MDLLDLFSGQKNHLIGFNGGVDDILWNEERDYFIGAGVRFTDNDIKSILGAIPKQ